MLKKITIEGIDIKEKTSRAGKPYTSVSILTKDNNGQDQWLGGFYDQSMASWEKGMQIDLEITPKVIKDKTFYNFTNPNKPARGNDGGLGQRVKDLETKVASLESQIVSGLNTLKETAKPADPFDAVNLENTEDVPF